MYLFCNGQLLDLCVANSESPQWRLIRMSPVLASTSIDQSVECSSSGYVLIARNDNLGLIVNFVKTSMVS